MSSTDTNALKERANLNSKGSLYNLEDWIIRQCKPYPGMRILDLGCGTGKQIFSIANLVLPRGYILGLDISDQAIKEVREKAKWNNFKHVKAVKCSFDYIFSQITNQYYDLILSSYAIYYAKDMVGLLSGLRDLMGPNGQLFVCGPGKGTNQEMTNLINGLSTTFRSEMLDDFIDNRSIREIGSHYSKYRTALLPNQIIFHSENNLLLWWKNHISYIPEIYEKVTEAIRSHFASENTFLLTKNVLGVHYQI